jgi:hypothetical protein
MKRLEIRRRTVGRVFDWFDGQCLAVPEIQREFVWNAQRACALLDSIYKPESAQWETNVKRGFRDFTIERARILRKAFEAAAETKLFDR